MGKKLILFLIALMVAVSLLGCGCDRINQSSMKDTAKTFVQALINGDEKVLDKINKSDLFNAPTYFLMSDFAPDFADTKLSNYEFDVNEEANIVSVIREGEEKAFIRLAIKK